MKKYLLAIKLGEETQIFQFDDKESMESAIKSMKVINPHLTYSCSSYQEAS
jgi:hypothetical protein